MKIALLVYITILFCHSSFCQCCQHLDCSQEIYIDLNRAGFNDVKIDIINFESIIIGDTPEESLLEIIAYDPRSIIEFDSIRLIKKVSVYDDTLMFYDDGSKNDLFQSDNIFTASKSSVFHLQVDSLEQFIALRPAWRRCSLELFVSNNGIKEVLNYYAHVTGLSISPRLVEESQDYQIFEDSTKTVQFTSEFINLVGDDNSDLRWEPQGEFLLEGEYLNSREFIEKNWCDEYALHPIFYDMAEVDTRLTASAGELGVNMRSSKDIITLIHEINHAYINYGIYSNLGNGTLNLGHFFFVERPSSAFGLGDYSGVFRDMEMDGNLIYAYNPNSENEDIEQYKFNDIELAIMGVIDYSSIKFPIRCISPFDPPLSYSNITEENCGDEICYTMNTDDGFVYLELDSIEFLPLYEGAVRQRNTWELDLTVENFKTRYVIKTDTPLSDTIMNVMSSVFNYFNAIMNSINSFDKFENDIQVPNCSFASIYTDADGDGFLNNVDCDDSDSNINPSQIEVPYNEVDDDCNPGTLDDDLDQDGFPLSEDCDENNPNINPSAEEIPNNGIDEDCDGVDWVTSIHELANTTINIYPNPATDLITINVVGQLKFRVKLIDMNGVVINTMINSSQLSIGSIPIGTYLIEVEDLITGQRIVERIVVGQ